MTTGIDRAQVTRAAAALEKHIKSVSKDASLLDGDEQHIVMQISLRTMPRSARPNPILVPLRHPIFESGSAEVLFIAHDPAEEAQQLIDRTPKVKSVITKIMGLSDLKKDHKSFEQKRLLLDSFDLVLADERILGALPRALGSKFYEKKRQPIAIRLRAGSLEKSVTEAVNSTTMTVSKGTCVSIRIGHTGMTPEQIADNVETALPLVRNKLSFPIQSIQLKGPRTVALPIWNYVPGSTADSEPEAPSSTKPQQKKNKGATTKNSSSKNTVAPMEDSEDSSDDEVEVVPRKVATTAPAKKTPPALAVSEAPARATKRARSAQEEDVAHEKTTPAKGAPSKTSNSVTPAKASTTPAKKVSSRAAASEPEADATPVAAPRPKRSKAAAARS